jgi:uncharacterized protein YndB with AHSA1/START domain
LAFAHGEISRTLSEIIMASTIITPDRDAVVSEIEIAAPPDRIFRALTERDQAMRWGGNEKYQLTHWEMDARLGGKWSLASKERTGQGQFGSFVFEHHGEIVEFDPPRVLAYSWYANWHEDPSRRTVVRWELTPTKTGTHAKVTHSGLAPLPAACEGYSQGWPGLVQAVKNFVERTM